MNFETRALRLSDRGPPGNMQAEPHHTAPFVPWTTLSFDIGIYAVSVAFYTASRRQDYILS